MPMSQLKYLGPRRSERNRGASPNVKAFGCENAAGLTQLLIDWFCATGFTPGTIFGRWLNPAAPVLLSTGAIESGKPDLAVRIPLHCQPPRTAFTGRLQSPPHCLPAPNGNS